MNADDWRRNLHTGDEVTWHDPDEPDTLARVHRGIILEIDYLSDDAALILFQDGKAVNVFLSELT